MSSGRRKPGRSWSRALGGGLGCAALLILAGCGGRSASVVSEINQLDQLFSCQHLTAEVSANTLRMEDLRDERVTNRLRNLTRVPGAFIGNPLSALALADTSLAIYREIDALERRNENVARMRQEKNCDGGGQNTLIALPGLTAPPAEPEDAAVADTTGATKSNGLASLKTPPADPVASDPTLEPANAETPPPDDSAIAAYAALLQSGAVTQKKPLDEALEARATGEKPAAVESASLPERSAAEIAQIAEDIETVQKAREAPASKGAKETLIPTGPRPAAQ